MNVLIRLLNIFRSSTLVVMLLPAFALTAQIDVDRVMRVGQNALYFEDYVLSIQYFNQAIQAKPYLAQPYLYRAIAKLNLDDFSGAEADADKAVELNPFLTDAWEVRGVARQNQNKLKGAIGDYKQALTLIPRNRQILFNMALAQTDDKQTAAADSTFDTLIRYYPGFENAYLGRAKLNIAEGDTLKAQADIDKALTINKNALNGYVMRAGIAISRGKDLDSVLVDMNNAVRLEPRAAGLYINRAYLRYKLDDYFGAMADFDYALGLEPANEVALFNRALLLSEVGDNDRAVKDYNRLLEIDPDNLRALYNRAVVKGEKHDYEGAVADINRIIARFPDFDGALFMRSEFYRKMGQTAKSKADYDRAMALMKNPPDASSLPADDMTTESMHDSSPEAAARRFASLLTIESETELDQEYNNSAIRGRVQERNVPMEIEPFMELTYYMSSGELGASTYFIKEVDDINASRLLRMAINVTSSPGRLNDAELISAHFNSIDYYNSYLATHNARAIDYIGRAMDFVTVRNYASAIEDLNRAIAITPDSPVAYALRAQARYHNISESDDALARQSMLSAMRDDIDTAVKLSPRSAPLWYNKGNIHYLLGDLTSAISAYTKAIELKSDMGEAFYNRGYVYMKMGNTAAGITDLSKAGELGVVKAYNLIKRMSN